MQNIIKEYENTPVEKQEEKYKEVLKTLFNMRKVFIPVTIENEVLKPFLTENTFGDGEITVRIFSETELGANFFRKYNLMNDDTKALLETSLEEFVELLKNGLYDGIERVLIDDGDHCIQDTATNILRSYFGHIGQPDLYNEELIRNITALNCIKVKGYDVLTISNCRKKNSLLEEYSLSDEAKSLVRTEDGRNIVPFFFLEEKADEYGVKNGYINNNGLPYKGYLNEHSFYDMVVELQDKVDEIELYTEFECLKFPIRSLVELMDKVGFHSYFIN